MQNHIQSSSVSLVCWHSLFLYAFIFLQINRSINEKPSTVASYFLFSTIKLLKARGVKKEVAKHFDFFAEEKKKKEEMP